MVGEKRMESLEVMMRFFTRAWLNGDLTDAEFDASLEEYQQHISLIVNKLPETLARFAVTVPLHDGWVLRVVTGDVLNAVRLVLRAGDLQRGYCDVELSYSGVSLFSTTPDVDEIAGNDEFMIVADEVDICQSAGIFEHRFMLSPHGAMVVRFSEFEYRVSSVAEPDS